MHRDWIVDEVTPLEMDNNVVDEMDDGDDDDSIDDDYDNNYKGNVVGEMDDDKMMTKIDNNDR
jgi:hypothetical protein